MKRAFLLSYIVFAHSVFMAKAQCQQAISHDSLNINNVNAQVNNGGDMWWNLGSTSKYVVPKTGNVSSFQDGGLWIGGLDAQGNIHVTAVTHRQTGNYFWPGPLNDSAEITLQGCVDFDRIWKVNKSTIDSFTGGQFSIPPSSIASWPGRGNPNLSFLPDQNLAPFFDVNGDQQYNPSDGDYPAIPGDQATWFVMNDKGGDPGVGQVPLGIEVQCIDYAFADMNSCTWSTTFYHYCITNKSLNDYDSIYIGFWANPSLGCYADDYMGTDSLNNLSVIYNAQAVDGYGWDSNCPDNYGNQPPVAAIQILQGTTDNNGSVHKLDHCMYYLNDFSILGTPLTVDEYYGYLKSIWKDQSHLTYYGNGYGGITQSDFAFTGDPSDGNNWSMCSTSAPFSDFRVVVSSGPVSLNHGATQTFDIAVLWENLSGYPCPSFHIIDSIADCTSDFFTTVSCSDALDYVPPLTKEESKVFPNPCSIEDEITFEVKGSKHLEIYDWAGRKLQSVECENQSQLRMKASSFARGIYFYRTSLINHSFQVGKFIIE